MRNKVEENDDVAFLAAIEQYGAIGSLLMEGGAQLSQDHAGEMGSDAEGLLSFQLKASPPMYLQIPNASIDGRGGSEEINATIPAPPFAQHVRTSTSADQGSGHASLGDRKSKQIQSKAAAGLFATAPAPMLPVAAAGVASVPSSRPVSRRAPTPQEEKLRLRLQAETMRQNLASFNRLRADSAKANRDQVKRTKTLERKLRQREMRAKRAQQKLEWREKQRREDLDALVSLGEGVRS